MNSRINAFKLVINSIFYRKNRFQNDGFTRKENLGFIQAFFVVSWFGKNATFKDRKKLIIKNYNKPKKNNAVFSKIVLQYRPFTTPIFRMFFERSNNYFF